MIRTHKKISLGRWHRVQAKRWHTDGMLRLDGHEAVEGRSQGPMRQLDLEARPLYVGGMPPSKGRRQGALLDNLGLVDAPSIGFSGCVRWFKLGYREVKVQSSLEPLSVRRRGIRECRAPLHPPPPAQPVVAFHDHQASSPCDARYRCCCFPGDKMNFTIGFVNCILRVPLA